jgi:hypothetical protein
MQSSPIPMSAAQLVGYHTFQGLTDSLCNDLTVAVGWNPRAWLFPPEDGELFDQPEHALLACKAT